MLDKSQLEECADCIAKKAFYHSKDKKFYSPFAKEAERNHYRYQGGKEDDITVIVAQIHKK